MPGKRIMNDARKIEGRKYKYRDKGIVEDDRGRVAGMWLRKRKGRVETILFEKPIQKEKPYKIEHKTITIDGKTYKNYPVKVFIEVNNLTHWNK